MIFIPLDVFRWQLLPRPPLGLSILGAMLSFGGYGIVLAALYQNAFAAPVVRHQSERGHTLVDTGLYGRVRHPFYTGLLVFLLGLALWLESYAAVPALSVVVASLVVRIHIEEKTLQHALPGYADYMGRVRYRLVPLIW